MVLDRPILLALLHTGMDVEMNFKENGPPEPDSTTQPDNTDPNIPKAGFGESIFSLSPVIDDREPNPDMPNTSNGELIPDHGPARSNGPGTPEKDENTEPKIVARPTPEDDFIRFVPTPHHRRAVSVDHLVAKVPAHYVSSPTGASTSARSKLAGDSGWSRGQIDTASPFESVKAAVSKFGGIVDWKAHRVQTVERRKFIEQELEKAQEELPTFKQRCEAAEHAKARALHELDTTKRLIDELKLNLERAHKEERQAKQDAELANLRVDEIKQGIADESSSAAKAQLEVARARHASAVSDLKAALDELDHLRDDYSHLLAEKEAAAKKADEAVGISKGVEQSVEDLTLELIAIKQSLESAHSEHLEVEEHRLGAMEAKEDECLGWEEELRRAEEEIERLNNQIMSTRELKAKLDEATSLLSLLKADLAAYMDMETRMNGKDSNEKTRGDVEAAISAAKMELEEVKLKIESTAEGTNTLREELALLKLEFDREKKELLQIQHREGVASIMAVSLKDELNTTLSEIAMVRDKEKEDNIKIMGLTGKLQEAAREADEAQASTQATHEELEKARDEAERAKATKLAKQSQLLAAQKEIEAAKAAERLALAAITALEQSESAAEGDTSGVTLSLEEYYELSKAAHEAEEEAAARVAAAISKIEEAKEIEQNSLKKLDELSGEISGRKDELEIAQSKAEEAVQGKLAAEQELRKWRADNEQRRKDDPSGPRPVITSFPGPALYQRSSPRARGSGEEKEKDGSPEAKATKKKKKSFLPRVFMFMARKKVQAAKKD